VTVETAASENDPVCVVIPAALPVPLVVDHVYCFPEVELAAGEAYEKQTSVPPLM